MANFIVLVLGLVVVLILIGALIGDGTLPATPTASPDMPPQHMRTFTPAGYEGMLAYQATPVIAWTYEAPTAGSYALPVTATPAPDTRATETARAVQAEIAYVQTRGAVEAAQTMQAVQVEMTALAAEQTATTAAIQAEHEAAASRATQTAVAIVARAEQQQANATATRGALDLMLGAQVARSARKTTQRRKTWETARIVLVVVAVIAIVVVTASAAYFFVSTGRAEVKAAEAKLVAEQRRMAQVRVAIAEARRAQAALPCDEGGAAVVPFASPDNPEDYPQGGREVA